MAFDYGAKRTGVAVTDPLQLIANSLPTVETKHIFDFVKKYCIAEEVECFAVGVPSNTNGRDNNVLKDVQKFIAQLEQLYPSKKVYKIDERFTSRIAQQTLLMSGVNRKERQQKGNVDAIAANLILQSYMELKANNFL